MKYKNTKTGVVIETTSVIFGGDWVPVEEPKKTPKKRKKAVKDELRND